VVKQLPLRIRRTEDREKKGSHGAWRKEFCRKYHGLIVKARQNSFDSMLESLSAEGKTISCRATCSHCCYHYVAVSLAQGILIVDYLYKRKALLKQFVDNYETWHRDGESISHDIDRIRIQALSSSIPMHQVLSDTRPLSNRYLETNTPCPFLVDEKCSIYEVRPMACSGHHSVSPPDWCAPASQQKPVIQHSMPDDEAFIEMIQLTGSQLTLYELTLPTMVYRLLNEGSSAMMTEIAELNLA
jgi:Fe-S-cluster containining protein